jgi:hypothetical protein
MKRWFVALSLILMTSALVGSVYSLLIERASPERCSMDWLARELHLTDAQYQAIWAAHTRLCPEIGKLGSASMAAQGVQGRDGCREACQQATGQLIAEVCAKLTPEQRSKYLQLVARCMRTGVSSP